MTTPTILIVDDEEDLVRLVRYNLEKEAFHVLSAYDGEGAWYQMGQKTPDLVILDLMLPDISGFEFCRKLKMAEETRKIPVIMLTARSSEGDRIGGFEAGAEDYVVKPFSPKELVWRVKARLGRTAIPSVPEPPTAITVGELLIYPDNHCVKSEQGDTFDLSYLEFQILLVLAKHPHMVKTREQVIQAVWGQDGDEISDRAVDTHIKRLRQKLGPYRDYIETIRGVGYRLQWTHDSH